MSPTQPHHLVLRTASRTTGELAAELRREFERVMLERYAQPPAEDPVLATLFHAFAMQLARVYDEAEQVFPEAVLDDVVNGLGMPPRAAEAAQTVIGFTGALAAEVVMPDLPLVGIDRRGEHVTFAVDVPVRIGPAQLAFAGVAEGGRLTVLPGASIPGPPEAPAGSAVPLPTTAVALEGVAASIAPTLFLAFDVDEAHLSGAGLFIETESGHPVSRMLARSAWQLLDEDGVARERLVLRSRTGPGGVRLLDWQHGAPASPDDVDAAPSAVPAILGAYGPMCWVWPGIPSEHRTRCRPPAAVGSVLPLLLPPGSESAYDRPLVWVQVALPAGTRGTPSAIQRVALHCAAASNVEAFAERLHLGKLGAVVAFRPEGARDRHPLAVLGVTGEQGERYTDENDPTAGIGRGRFRRRGDQIEVHPARGSTGRFDRHVGVRLLYTDGARANGLQPGDIAAYGARMANVGVAAAYLVPSRGGSGPPAYASARIRFAELLRTRERVVTEADINVCAQAFEPRILGADAVTVMEVGEDRVPRRVEVVRARVCASEFGDPSSEFPRLAAALETHLRARSALGTWIRVEVRAGVRGQGAVR